MSSNVIVPSIECPAPVLAHGKTGIQRVAVNDAATQILVTFWAPITAAQSYLLKPVSYSLSGGQRLFPRVITAQSGAFASPPDTGNASVLLTLDQLGDFSTYTLTVSGPDIDPFFGSAKLRFRLACEDSFDCRVPSALAATAPQTPVTIDYLSKDYAGFRQALLDFIPTRLPAWTERSEADIGMTILELFAATADSLSYLQDRVANEAFLSTAQQRRSVAGHLALIGYEMDSGNAASTWLQFQVTQAHVLTGSPGFKVSNQAPGTGTSVLVFETLGTTNLVPAHNAMALYNWGNSNCCLGKDALSAALIGSLPQLRAGDYLLFDDGAGNRDVVRLTLQPQIVPIASTAPVIPTSPPTVAPQVFLTNVTWAKTTPLSQDYCVAQTTVRGNLAPATHGETLSEIQTTAPAPTALGTAGQGTLTPSRQRITLTQGPLAYLDTTTLALGLPFAQAAAPQSATTDRPVTSASTLRVEVNGQLWTEQKSLLQSGPNDQVFRIELDDDGDATLVFGDGTFGKQLPPGATISLTYRMGGGAGGNVSAGSLTFAQPATPAPWLKSVSNPLPGTGGRDLESSDAAREAGPAGIHTTVVAVTADDFAQAATSYTDAAGQPLVQRANADFRWSGSWLTVTVSVDPMDTDVLTDDLKQGLLTYLGNRRLTGYDLQILGPFYVGLEMQLQFTALPGSQPDAVEQALLNTFSSATRTDGTLGFFHPDNFTFGQDLYLSAIYAAAITVPGLQSARVLRLCRYHAAQPDQETRTNIAQGFVSIGRDQIVRLDNDPDFPQNGTLTLSAKGASA